MAMWKLTSKHALTGALLSLVLGLAALPLDATVAPVKTDAGLVSGAPGTGGVVAYLGIPYAAPPVGALRWRPPQPAAHWAGVRAADRFGTSCMQAQPGSRLPWTEEFMTQGPIGEDCLSLNVWTPATSASARLPVMVWIYGGGFNEGSSAVAVYDGAALARKGVIVVSMNYRVGALGFLAHPELSRESEHHVSGNYGLLDQIAALQWVRRNIGAFGGDAARVTIFGQSAGALSVAGLMQSPLAKGLFARAIAQSGPGLLAANALGGTASLADRETAGVRYAEAKGARSLAELRALEPAVFFAPGGRGSAPLAGGLFKDGWVLPERAPADQVPLLVGFVADDLGMGGGGAAPSAPAVAAWQSDAQRAYGERADAFLKLYPVSSDADVAAVRKAAGRDRARISLDRWSAGQLEASKRIYTYYFDRAIPWPAHPEYGAFHSSEIPYIFETLERMNRPWEAVDRQLAGTVSSYWTNFARSGDPNGAGLPVWPAYDPSSQTTMELGEKVGAMRDAEPARAEFFVNVLKR